ncbi:MAG: hypothetical protein LIO63_01715 [Akkermansia sp.]|nr:hypothetical protein [Akkermansia sp.]
MERPDDKTLIRLYKKYNSAQIAEMYGAKDSTVRSWFSHLRKEEAEKRGRSESSGKNC